MRKLGDLIAEHAEHLAELRARLEVSPPELPKFSMPVPDPLENERVEWALAYLTGDRKGVIQEGLSRSTAYMPMIEAIFDEVGIPRELAWSAGTPAAGSPNSARAPRRSEPGPCW